MAHINAQAPDGTTLKIDIPEGTDQSQYGAMVDDVMSHYTSTLPKEQGPLDAGVEAGKGVLQAAFAPLNPEVPKRFTKSLLGIPQEEPHGFMENAVNSVGKNALPLAASIAVQPYAIPAAAATGFMAPVTENAITGAAAGAGRYLQTQMQNAGSALGSGAPMVPQDETARQALTEGAVNAAGGLAIRGGIAAGKAVGKPVFNYLATSKIGGAIKEQAWQFFKDNLDRVKQYIGADKELGNSISDNMRENLNGFIAKSKPAAAEADALRNDLSRSIELHLGKIEPNPADADVLAGKAKKGIDTAIEQLRDEYPRQLDAIAANPKYQNKEFNLNSRFRNDLFKVQSDYLYDDLKTVGDTPEAKIFNSVTDKIADLKHASVDQVIGYAKMLKKMARNYKGTQLGSAFRDFSRTVTEGLEGDISELAAANQSWKKSIDLEDISSGISGANNPVQYIKNAYGSQFATEQKAGLDMVRQISPEINEAISGVQNHLGKAELSKQTQKMAGTLLNSNDPVQLIEHVYKTPGMTARKEAIEQIAAMSPEIKATVDKIHEYNAKKLASEEISDLVQKTANKNDLLKHIDSVFSQPESNLERKGFERVQETVPGMADQVQNARAFMAGQQVSPLLRGLPANGLGGFALYGVGKLAVNAIGTPLTMLGALGAPGWSPRAYAYGYMGARAINPMLESAAGKTAQNLTGAIGGSTAYQYLRPQPQR